MGEIGIPRREFLYDLRFWEVRRIIHGYRQRDRLKHQLLAEIVYTTLYTMRDPKGQTAKDLFPGIFTDKDDGDDFDFDDDPPITDDDIKGLQQLMTDLNTPSQSDPPDV